jgi:hypothetical protein
MLRSQRCKDLREQQRLDRAALVHRTVALRHLLEGQRKVEDLAGVNLPLPQFVSDGSDAPLLRLASSPRKSTLQRLPPYRQGEE